MSAALTPERIDHLCNVYQHGLLAESIPFWMTHGLDRECGGIMTSLNRDGTILDADKGVWQQGRFAWVLGYLYNTVEQRPEWLAAAEATLRFLEAHCFDTDGRMFFEVTRDGRPIRKRRYAFSEAFAAMAFGEHTRATGNAASKSLAERLYRAYAGHVPSPPEYTDTRPMKSMATPMILLVVGQRLRDSIGLACADEDIDRAIAEIRRDFRKPEIGCCMENVGPAGELLDGFDGRLLNPGHAIEGAWFMMYEGKIHNRREYIQAGCSILDWMWECGWDHEYGGMLYYRDLDGRPVAEYWHDMKFWWPQNETIIATLRAYQLTGDEKYAKMHTTIHDYAYRLFPDFEFGDWFGYFHRDGRLSTPLKGSLLVWSAVTLAMGCATSFRQLYVLRALMGVSEALYIPAGLALIADYHRDRTRSLAVGIHMTGLYVGQALGGFGATIARDLSWQRTFRGFGFIGIAYALVLVVLLRENPARSASGRPKAQALGGGLGSVARSLGLLLGTVSFWVILFYFAAPSFPGWATKNWLPTLLARSLGWDMAKAGPLATLVIASSAFAGVVVGGLIADRWIQKDVRGRVYTGAIGLGLTVPAIVLLGLGQSLPAVLGGGILFGIGFGIFDANNMPILCQFVSPAHRAAGYGLMNMVGVSAGALVTTLLGKSADAGHLGRDMAFLAIPVVLALVLQLTFLKPTSADREK